MNKIIEGQIINGVTFTECDDDLISLPIPRPISGEIIRFSIPLIFDENDDE